MDTKDTTRSTKMPDQIKNEYDNWSPFQRKFAEFRSRGKTLEESAKLAGSSAEDKKSRTRVGWQVEQMPMIKEYISWLQLQRASAISVDEVEIVSKLRAVIEQGMDSNKLADVNKAIELLANLGGLLEKGGKATKDSSTSTPLPSTPKNNTNVFKNDVEEQEDMDDMELIKSNKVKKLHQLINQLDKSSKDK